MNLSTTSVLLFLLSHNAAASTEDKDTSALLRGGQSDSASLNISDNQYHRELPPAWKTRGCKINGEKIGIYIGGGIGKLSHDSLNTSCAPQMLIFYVYFSVRPII